MIPFSFSMTVSLINDKVEQERSSSSEKEVENTTPEEDTPEEWFKVACYLASRGNQKEAEVAIKKSLNLQDDNAIAWGILSAILLSQSRETDAEQAGKKAISQCAGLKMTWTKMRTIIISNAIVKGVNWKDPRRVVIESVTSTEWGNILSELSKSSQQDLDEITTFEEAPTKKEKTEELKPLLDEIPNEPDKVDTKPEPEDASLWFSAAENHLKHGNLVEAEKAFLRGLEIDPKRGDAWLSVSSLLMGKQKYDEAIDALHYATTQIPLYSGAWYQLGYCLQKVNKWKEAIEPIRRALKLERNNPDYWLALGLSEFNLGHYQEAAKSLVRVVRISPNHKDALFYLAICMERRGNRKHALSLYIKLLNMGGLNPKMLEQMAGAFERLNRPTEARASRRRAGAARKSELQ